MTRPEIIIQRLKAHNINVITANLYLVDTHIYPSGSSQSRITLLTDLLDGECSDIVLTVPLVLIEFETLDELTKFLLAMNTVVLYSSTTYYSEEKDKKLKRKYYLYQIYHVFYLPKEKILAYLYEEEEHDNPPDKEY